MTTLLQMISHARRATLVPVLAVGLLLASNASASLIGDTVSCSYGFSLRACSDTTAEVIDPGAEFMLGSQLSVDIGDSSILISQVAGTFGLPGADEVLIIGDMQWTDFPDGFISGVTLGTVTNLINEPTLENLSFTPDSVTIALTGTGTWTVGSSIEVLVEATHVIPLPPAVWLFASALGLLGWLRRQAT